MTTMTFVRAIIIPCYLCNFDANYIIFKNVENFPQKWSNNQEFMKEIVESLRLFYL